MDATPTDTPDHGDQSDLTAKLQAANERLAGDCARLAHENEMLRQRIDLLLRQIYGSKSERVDPGQLELLLEGTEAKKPEAADVVPEDESAAVPKRPRKPRTNRLRKSMESLPVEVERHVPPEVLENPGAYRKVKEIVTERLEVDPAQYRRRQIVREIYQLIERPEQPPITPPLPKPLLEGSVLSPSLLADILDKKYCQHLPFYRQEWIMRNAHGLDISRNLLCHWHDIGAQWLEPLYKLLHLRLRSGSYLQCDETWTNYQVPGHGKVKKGYFWVIYNPTQGVLYRWGPGRGREHLDALLFEGTDAPPFKGWLQCDAYAVYKAMSADEQEVLLVSCLAHIRRNFYDARADQPRYALWVIDQIRKLYAIEEQLRAEGADAEQRRVLRQQRARPIYRWIKRALVGMRAKPSVLPTSPMGKALDYALHQWGLLEAYLDNGELEIDNNQVENAIRPLKLGAKNWLFIGRESTGWRTAVVLTLVENVRRRGYSPRAYLQWVFERLPSMTTSDDLSQLLPEAWIAMQEAQKAAQPQAA